MKRLTICAILLCAVMALWVLACGAPPSKDEPIASEQQPQAGAPDEFACMVDSFFQNSLHFTTQGMRYWYDAEDGFGQIAGKKYDEIGCRDCHAKNCDACHAEQTDAGMIFSVAKALAMDTCLPCHSREQAAMGIDEKAGKPDVHFAAGYICSSCHTGSEIHGTGQLPNSMRDIGYMQVGCENCHEGQNPDAPVFDAAAGHHIIHGDKLDCAACHVSNTMACYNCHFSKFMETGEKKGNFVPNKSWMMLINYDGKVTSGTIMTLVNGKKTFVTYGPYFTHSIMQKGHDCSACHMNDAVKLMMDGKKVPVATFENGQVVFWNGIIPTVADLIENLYLDKDENGNWIPLVDPEDPLVQFSVYGEPLTEEQMKKLQMPMG
jgi:hypothetical protein